MRLGSAKHLSSQNLSQNVYKHLNRLLTLIIGDAESSFSSNRGNANGAKRVDEDMQSLSRSFKSWAVIL